MQGPTFPDLLSRLWDPFATTAGAAVAALVGHLWRRFRNRMVLLRCQISHTPATNTAGLGDQIEVKYAGFATPNLYLCTLTVQNDSSKDLANVVLNMAYQDGTLFLSGGGSVMGSNQSLSYTPEYEKRSNALWTLPENDPNRPAEQAWIFSHRDYLIPVLNRDARVQFAFTVHGIGGTVPTLSVGCDHLGARLVLQAPRQLFWGEPNDRAALIGLAAGLVLLLLLPSVLDHSWKITWLMFLLGASTIVVGAVLMKLWRAFLRMLS